MNSRTSGQCEWTRKYNYREAPSINSCELCSYAQEIDVDGERGVEALVCDAASDDTGNRFEVEFSTICDLYEPELLENKPDAD